MYVNARARRRRPQDRTRPVPRGRAPRSRLGAAGWKRGHSGSLVLLTRALQLCSTGRGGLHRLQAHLRESETAFNAARRARGAKLRPALDRTMLKAVSLAILAVAASGFVAPATPRQATALAASGSQIAYRIRRKRIANQVRDSAHHSLPAKLRLTCFSPAGQGPVAPERVPVEQPHLRPGHRR